MTYDTLAASRHRSPYALREKIARMVWAIVQGTLVRWSFHNWNRWRIAWLSLFGADVHKSCVVRRSVRVECPWNLTMGANSCLGDRVQAYCLGRVTIGQRVSISQGAHLCAGTHDYDCPDMLLLRTPIQIGDDAWIAADAFVGPGVVVGDGAILGARGVACGDLDAWTIYVGNPAVSIKSRERPSSSDATGT